jgi:hypothetical protein
MISRNIKCPLNDDLILFFLILDTKLPEIENTVSLAAELGFIVFKASNNISKFFLFFYWLPQILKMRPSVG